MVLPLYLRKTVGMDFYSLGASWEVKRENFLDDVDAISNLRLRASYGTTASPFTSNFGYLPAYGSSSYGGNAAIVPYKPGNPNYDWEYAKELNIGFDLGLLNNRIRLTTEFYNRITSNLFINQGLFRLLQALAVWISVLAKCGTVVWK